MFCNGRSRAIFGRSNNYYKIIFNFFASSIQKLHSWFYNGKGGDMKFYAQSRHFHLYQGSLLIDGRGNQSPTGIHA